MSVTIIYEFTLISTFSHPTFIREKYYNKSLNLKNLNRG